MLELHKTSETALVIEDTAAKKRVANAVVIIVGIALTLSVLAGKSTEGILFFLGLFLVLLCGYILLTIESRSICFDKAARTIVVTCRSLLRTRRQEYDLAALTDGVSLQWSSSSEVGDTGWMLTIDIGEEELLSINQNHAPTTNWFRAFRDLRHIGEDLAVFLDIPFQQKKWNEE